MPFVISSTAGALISRRLARVRVSARVVGTGSASVATGPTSMADVGKPLNTYLNNLPTTVFSVMTEMAIKHQSVNLGQGFPDDEGPKKMKQIVGEASLSRHNQYPPTGGGIPDCLADVLVSLPFSLTAVAVQSCSLSTVAGSSDELFLESGGSVPF